jgi:ribose transport system ATP-binding protein
MMVTEPELATPLAGVARPLGDVVLRCTGIDKSFPGVHALTDVSMTVHAGSVHALLGENGAGKSTLIKVITGVHRPDAGLLEVNGSDVRFSSPHAAVAAGIGAVHQERNLVPEFSVAENIALQAIPNRFGVVDRSAVTARARRCLAELELDLDPAVKVKHLSPAQSQLVEIAKALALDSQILLLDEPTASLTGDESEHLFAVVRRLAAQGRAVIFVSHKLDEVFAICDTATVLRDGRSVIDSRSLIDATRKQVIDAMVGREYQGIELAERQVDRTAVPALELESLSTVRGHRGIDLTVHAGEVVGLYGLVGAGRSELARAVVGLDRTTDGRILVDGQPATISSLGDALGCYRIGYVTENRKDEGLFLDQTVTRNIAVTVWSKLQRRLAIAEGTERSVAARFVESLGIKVASLAQTVGTLSGGNQQKVSLAKWLAAECRILIVDEPTVGIDIRTKGAFHELIAGLAASGLAVLLITSDLAEMVTLADRILVMHELALTGEVDPGDRDYRRVSREVMRHIHRHDEPDDDQAEGPDRRLHPGEDSE